MPTDPNLPSSGGPAAAEVVLREQRLAVSTVRVPTERVVLRRRLVTEVRQVEITIQREELEVLRVPVEPGRPAVPGTSEATATPTAPLVIVLSEQVPVVHLQTRAYERVTVTVEQVTAQHHVDEQVSREQAEVLDPGEPEPR